MLGGVSRSEREKNASELSSSMLAPCDLLAGRDDSLGPKILSQRWLGLTTLGGKIPSWSDKTSDAHNKRMQNAEHIAVHIAVHFADYSASDTFG